MGVDEALNGGGKYPLEVVWTGNEIINIKPKRGSRPCSGQKPIALKSVCVPSIYSAVVHLLGPSIHVRSVTSGWS